MSNEELKSSLVYWQKRLRLQDWDIVLELVRLKEWLALGKDAYTAGVCAANRPCGWARIRLLHIDDIAEDAVPSIRDPEVTLVHELLHLVMPVSSPEGDDAHGERAINRIAEALVTERRMRA